MRIRNRLGMAKSIRIFGYTEVILFASGLLPAAYCLQATDGIVESINAQRLGAGGDVDGKV